MYLCLEYRRSIDSGTAEMANLLRTQQYGSNREGLATNDAASKRRLHHRSVVRVRNGLYTMFLAPVVSSLSKLIITFTNHPLLCPSLWHTLFWTNAKDYVDALMLKLGNRQAAVMV